MAKVTNFDCGLSLISARNKIAGKIHARARRETRRTSAFSLYVVCSLSLARARARVYILPSFLCFTETERLCAA